MNVIAISDLLVLLSFRLEEAELSGRACVRVQRR